MPADATAFHVFLLATQSNMAGRGDVAPADTVPIPRVLALGNDGRWKAAIDPIHCDKPAAGVGLARSSAAAYLPDHSGVTIGFVPAACGGSPIAMWKSGRVFQMRAALGTLHGARLQRTRGIAPDPQDQFNGRFPRRDAVIPP